MNKCYYRIVWENYPSDKTPVDEYNLNKVDVAVDEMDNRIILLDANKFDKSEAQLLVKYIEYDEDTGIFTVTHYNGSSYQIDTLLEKLAINFDYDYQSQKLLITLSDGEVKEVDLSALITQYEFLDSKTVMFTVDKDGKVTADIKEGSIEEKHLRPDYLADIKVVEEKAKADALASAQSAKESGDYANLSKSYAVGTDGAVREGDETDNAKYYNEEMQKIAEKQDAALDTKVNKAGDTMTGSLSVEGSVTAERFVGNADSATAASRLKSSQIINGVSFNGTYSVINYGVCSVESDIVEKTVECSGFVLGAGAEITVKFTTTNTESNPTLNVNSTGAKPIYYRGAPMTKGALAENHTYTFRYNGTQYELVGDINEVNTATSNGYVTKGQGNPNRVWGTDANGNPGWQDISGVSGDYLSLSGGVVDGAVGVNGNFVVGTNSKVMLWEDSEGGNLSIVAPDSYGNRWEIDAHNGYLRFINFFKGGEFLIPLNFVGNVANFLSEIHVQNHDDAALIRFQNDKRNIWIGAAGDGSFYIHDDTNGQTIIQSSPDGVNTFLGRASMLRDVSNGNNITAAYSKDGLDNPTWLAGWNGYELRAVSRTSLSVNYANSAGSVAWGNVSGKPSTYTPSSHSHSYLPLSGGILTGALTVNGAVSADRLQLRSGTTLNIGWCSFLNLRSSGIQCRNAEDTAWSGISASSFTTQSNSSLTLKDNIADITDERAKQILDVRVVTFDYKEGVTSEEHRYNRSGVIAEHTEKACSEVINYEDGKPTGVQYDRFIPYLIKMVQMQQKEIDTLKVEKEMLSEQIARIKAQIGLVED